MRGPSQSHLPFDAETDWLPSPPLYSVLQPHCDATSAQLSLPCPHLSFEVVSKCRLLPTVFPLICDVRKDEGPH